MTEDGVKFGTSKFTEDESQPLRSRARSYLTQYSFEHRLEELPWDLRDGPGSSINRPDSEHIRKSGKKRYDDELDYFGYILFFFRKRYEPECVLGLLRSLEGNAAAYKKLIQIIDYHSVLDSDLPIGNCRIRAFFYLVSLNALFTQPPEIFDFIAGKFTTDSLAKNHLESLKADFYAQFSLKKSYQMLFAKCLVPEEKQLLLQGLSVRDDSGRMLPLSLDRLVGELYTAFRCGGAHGGQLLPFTYFPSEATSSGINLRYRSGNKSRWLQSTLSQAEWERLVQVLIFRHFSA